MPAARVRNASVNSDTDSGLELTPPQRLHAIAELLVIGLQRLREPPRGATISGPALGPFPASSESSEFRTNELA